MQGGRGKGYWALTFIYCVRQLCSPGILLLGNNLAERICHVNCAILWTVAAGLRLRIYLTPATLPSQPNPSQRDSSPSIIFHVVVLAWLALIASRDLPHPDFLSSFISFYLCMSKRGSASCWGCTYARCSRCCCSSLIMMHDCAVHVYLGFHSHLVSLRI